MSQGEIHTVASDHAAGKKEDENGINVQLTKHQVHLIKETWQIVSQDLEKAGTVMFMKWVISIIVDRHVPMLP